MKLGVDVDGVVLDSVPLYDAVLQKRGIFRDPRDYTYKADYGILEGLKQEAFREVEQLTDVPLIPGAQILNKIVDLPHIEPPIHFVSSRSIESRCSTVAALKHHFDFPILLQCSTGKGRYCDFFGLDFFVEDGPPHIEDIYVNSATKIYILDKPYNQEIDLLWGMDTKYMLRVKNWDEILIDLQREGYREAVT